jgi:hypothetical protein
VVVVLAEVVPVELMGLLTLVESVIAERAFEVRARRSWCW